eukprot:CAMPEP_0175001240 /NCGR_PEP_ID=MMETSP0005-20121125/3024_1 /TAXON_ID=420556 /ORGANISM="Ochromonas sp., Strain CCMP1393" /LENGTH=931 /DNA_ID=CAMNT_0016256105 /DNA_START=25 /DNA_END=2820 /DNA_ORIENTATION=+
MGGSSSKSTFSNIVGKILVSDIDPSDHDFWDEMWKTVLPAEDVFDMISPEDVRKIISDHPNNMKTIVTQAVAQLYQVVETPYRIYFEQALNCSRIMSLLPFLLESSSAEMKDLLWNRRAPSQQVSSENLAADSRDMGSEGEDADPQASEPLAVILVNTIFHLLFLPDFTVDDPNVEFTEKDINTPEFKSALMWAPGIGSSEKTIVNSTQFDHNRIDVLRLMICAFCDSLYQAADNYDSCASMWLEVATSADAPYAEIVFYSLFNTVLGYDPIGWGLPYGSMITTDTAKLVMEAAVQVLIALLDYGHPIRTAESSAAAAAAVAEGSNPLPSVSAHDTEAQGFNIFRCLLGKIEAPDQLNFVYRGFVRLLNNVHQAESTFLPHSVTRIDIEQELLVLFWKCLEEMPKFMPYILMHCDATELLVPICYLMLQGRRDPTKVGLMYLCTFTLLKLSGERTFGVALNKPYQLHLPVDLPLFSGNHADLLVVVLHKLIVSGQEKLSALYSCFLTIICNISPYIKSFGTVASVKLVNLLQLFVSPRFLYAAEGNHVYVSMLLETLNNIVQYQYEGNGQLIYAIIRRKEVFDSIANLKLPASAAAAAAAAMAASKRASASNSAHRQSNAITTTTTTDRNGNSTTKSNPDDDGLTTATTTPSHTPPGTTAGNDGESPSIAAEEAAAAVAADTAHTPAAPTELISTSNVKPVPVPAPVGGAAEVAVKGPPAGESSDTTANTAKAIHTSTSISIRTGSTVESTTTGKKKFGGTKTLSVAESSSGNGNPINTTSTTTNNTINGNSNSSSSSSSSNSSSTGRRRFVPTEEWLAAVKADLPLSTVMRLLRHLVPQVEALAAANDSSSSSSSSVDEDQVLAFLRSTTMVGLLPVPHPIVIRKYQPNRFTCLWFTAFQWGVIFMHNTQSSVPLFDGQEVKLFIVQNVY